MSALASPGGLRDLLGRAAACLAGPLARAFGTDPASAFTAGLVALSAKMARSDGVVMPSEVEAFRRVVEVPAGEEAGVRHLFDLAKGSTAGFEAYASRLRRACDGRPALLEDVLDALFHIATADGALLDVERAYLARVAELFGLGARDYARIEARHALVPGDPYLVLGAERELGDEALKSHYRALVRETHPDRRVALGLPAEAVRLATTRLAAINAAWDAIAAERGLRPGPAR